MRDHLNNRMNGITKIITNNKKTVRTEMGRTPRKRNHRRCLEKSKSIVQRFIEGTSEIFDKMYCRGKFSEMLKETYIFEETEPNKNRCEL